MTHFKDIFTEDARPKRYFDPGILQNTVPRTIFFTQSAVGTFIVIDMRHIVGNGDSFHRAVLLAFLTADTAVITGRHGSLALIRRTALYFSQLLIRNQFNQMMRTYGYTFAAGFTFFFVYHRNSIFNMDCVEGTRFYASTVSKTAAVTFFCAAAGDKCHD